MTLHIDPVSRPQQSRSPQEQVELLRNRYEPVNLFANTQFERVAPPSSELVRQDLPLMEETQQLLNSDLAATNAQQQSTINEAIHGLALSLLNELPTYVPGQTVSSGAVNAAEEAIEIYLATTGRTERDSAEQEVFGMALYGFERDLAEFATNLHNKIGQATLAREEATELDLMLADWPPGTTQEFTWTAVTQNPDGSISTQQMTKELTRSEAEELKGELEGLHASLMSQTELEKFELQDLYQGFQRATQLMSEIIKLMHDTQKVMIQNARA